MSMRGRNTGCSRALDLPAPAPIFPRYVDPDEAPADGKAQKAPAKGAKS